MAQHIKYLESKQHGKLCNLCGGKVFLSMPWKSEILKGNG